MTDETRVDIGKGIVLILIGFFIVVFMNLDKLEPPKPESEPIVMEQNSVLEEYNVKLSELEFLIDEFSSSYAIYGPTEESKAKYVIIVGLYKELQQLAERYNIMVESSNKLVIPKLSELLSK